MSSISFKTKSKELRISGSERAYMGKMAHDLFMLSLGSLDDLNQDCWIRRAIPDTSYIHNYNWRDQKKSFQDAVDSYLFASHWETSLLYPDGSRADPFVLGLNTMHAMGSNALKFFARLHAQCELLCYTEEENREFIADVIDEGVASSIYRDEWLKTFNHYESWSDVSEFYRNIEEHPGPVVNSYSVTKGFPYSVAIEAKPQSEVEEMEREQIWDLAIKYHRENDSSLEIKSEHFNSDYRYGDETTGFEFKQITLNAINEEDSKDS